MSVPLSISHACGYVTNLTLGAGNVQVNSLRNIIALDKKKVIRNHGKPMNLLCKDWMSNM